MELSPIELAAARAAEQRDAGLSATRRSRQGIVHTPPQLARAVARLADELIKDALGLSHGIADRSLGIVDPACGPGAFLAAALTVGERRDAVPRAVAGYDLDGAAIAAAHTALDNPFALAGWPCELNTIDTLGALRPERVASVAPALLVLGNPPWIGRAQAKPVAFMRDLLADFEREPDGEPLRERKRGVLSDAYVRFLRWSLELARSAERGAVLALVTNGSYLDGPVHRGMRAMLQAELDVLQVVDLGGNALLARSQERDDNVFGVRPQVAVLLAARRPHRVGRALAPVHYRRVMGAREDKLHVLARLSLADASAQRLQPQPPFHRFVPTRAARDDYASWPSLPQLFPFHREGVQTNRDALVIDRDRAALLARVHAFARGAALPELSAELSKKPHFDPERVRNRVRAVLAEDPEGEHWLRPIAYRPFDQRWLAAIAPLCHRPRPALIAAMDHSGVALVSVRKDRGALPWTHAMAASGAIDNCLLSVRSSCRARAFPSHGPDGEQNLSPLASAELGVRVGRAVTCRELIAYALCFLCAPSFVARHDDALRLDYPRIPWPRDAEQFERLVAAGDRLVALFVEPLDRASPQMDPQKDVEPTGSLRIGHHLVPAQTAATNAPRSSALDARVAALSRALAVLDGLLQA